MTKEFVSLLLSLMLLKNHRNENALHFAIETQFFVGAKTILSYVKEEHRDKIINSKTKEQMTPLFLAMYYRHDDVVNMILEIDELDYKAVAKDEKTALHLAVEYRQLHNVDKLFQKSDVLLLKKTLV